MNMFPIALWLIIICSKKPFRSFLTQITETFHENNKKCFSINVKRYNNCPLLVECLKKADDWYKFRTTDSLLSYCDPGAQASQVEALKLKQPGVVLLKITGVGVTTVAFCTTVVFITAGASVVWLCTKPEGGEPGHPSANSCLTRPVHEYPTYKTHRNDVDWSASFTSGC